ncbi:MAG: DUF4150 domain-containing protein [Polyangiaceae bacterium]
MSVTVSVNTRTVVHKGSDGFSIASPDVCLTQSVPVPYVNVAFSRDSVDTAGSVFADGYGIVKASSAFSPSYGDEPGTGGGIFSGVNQGRATFTNYSTDVLIEGEFVPRALDPMAHNQRNPPNVWSPIENQLLKILDPVKLYLCLILCVCEGHGNTMCADLALSMPRGSFRDPKGMQFDPYFPGLWVEPTYNIRSNPADLVQVETYSAFQHDLFGRPLELPWSYPPLAGSRRCDVVLAEDPTQPPRTDNIARIYDFKFKGDDWDKKKDINGEDQYQAYLRLAGGDPDKVVSVSERSCPSCGSFALPIIGPLLDEPDPELYPTIENEPTWEPQHPVLWLTQEGSAERELPDPEPPKDPDPPPPPKKPPPPPPPKEARASASSAQGP